MYVKFINNKKDLIELNNLIKSDNDISGCILSKKLKNDEYIISFIDEKTNEISSFIWFGVYENNNLGKYIHTNFSYTLKKYRSNGLNKLLRLKLEEFAIEKKINNITTTPLEKSPSLNIVLNLGYISKDNFYLKILS